MVCPIICTLNTWRKIMQFCVRTEKRALCKSPYRGIAKSAYYLCTAMCVTNLNCRYDRLQPLLESFLSQCRRPVLHHIHKEKGKPDIQDANQRQQHTESPYYILLFTFPFGYVYTVLFDGRNSSHFCYTVLCLNRRTDERFVNFGLRLLTITPKRIQ